MIVVIFSRRHGGGPGWRGPEDAGSATHWGAGARLEAFGMFGAVGSVEVPGDVASADRIACSNAHRGEVGRWLLGRAAVLIW